MSKKTIQTSMNRSLRVYSEGREKWGGHPVAVLWDQSLLWGLICFKTLEQLGVPFRLLSAGEIAAGSLEFHRVLVVPGGWASHKVSALGETGKRKVKQFIENGGSYVGFCGGAGLALSSPPSLGLVPLERMQLSERLPNASGEMWIQGVPDHPLWEDLPPALPVCIWWPSQFLIERNPESLCLATYTAPGADFWVADLPLCDLHDEAVPWGEWEKVYGINLDPARLQGHPAIVEVRVGKGRLILSYPHLDTPGHFWANRLFLRCLQYLDKEACKHLSEKDVGMEVPIRASTPLGTQTFKHICGAKDAADGLIDFGERHLLWSWRLPWLLNWRRGIRGLEYGTLAVVMAHLFEHAKNISARSYESHDPWVETAQKIEEEVIRFCLFAKSLLMEEKVATQTRNLTKLGKVNTAVDRMRAQLFGDKMNHGGICRALFDRLDRFLLEVLRMRSHSDE